MGERLKTNVFLGYIFATPTMRLLALNKELSARQATRYVRHKGHDKAFSKHGSHLEGSNFFRPNEPRTTQNLRQPYSNPPIAIR